MLDVAAREGREPRFIPDVDGLRAIAVLFVVLFHFDAPGFAGGYVGVDIFFVISGFLITGQIQKKLNDGSFSFSNFYAARTRRLFPSILATISCTFVAAVFLLPPDMLRDFAWSGVAASFSLANIFFFLQTGYWDTQADLKPLLHLWSLGVEEQFYLLWPLLMYLIFKLINEHKNLVFIGMLVVSFGTCVYVTNEHQSAAFYLIFFRAWQFCLGALALEVWKTHVVRGSSVQWARRLGILLCLCSAMVFDSTTLFPGWRAAVPSMGAALVIIASANDTGSRWLAHPYAQWLGRMSFAIYLTHWPPIALYKAVRLTTPSFLDMVGLMGVVGVLSLFLHYGIEKQFYRRSFDHQKAWAGVPAWSVFLCLIMTIILTFSAHNSDSVTFRDVMLGADKIGQYKHGRIKQLKACNIVNINNAKCGQDGDTRTLFFGNSHEVDAVNIFSAALPEVNKQGWVRFGSTNDCKFYFSGAAVNARDPRCQKRLKLLKDGAKESQWHTVVYSALNPFGKGKAKDLAILSELKSLQPDLEIIVMSDYISTTVSCADLTNKYGTPSACKMPDYIDRLPGFRTNYDVKIRASLEEVANVYVNKVEFLCDDKIPESCQVATPDGHPMSVDKHHLTYEFAQYLGNRIRQENPVWLKRMRRDYMQPE